ncbi:YhcN/YlaJ family sporulation lipoprotein [Caldalkalibacillus salinus]|uniref:YhcN/YlaJ family sporulation lipoprotein n=1 Tax=Caldalkalibacillus salinus TaxID=2803787 RepID=UPI001925156F|nr:YhcN/YlaJ family sporulation lipoprotein [Caldalkalibacillus salinus]
MKSLKILILILIAIALVAGCQDKEEQGQGEQQNKQKAQSEQQQGNEPQYIHAHYMEEEIETLDEVEHSVAILQEQDAYISVELSNQVQELNEDVKNRIVSLVRTSDQNVQNIYVSDNPDLGSRFTGLARDIERAEPESSIGESFDQTIRKYFPELKR